MSYSSDLPRDVVVMLITPGVTPRMELLALTSMLYVVPGSRSVKVAIVFSETIMSLMISPPGSFLYVI